MTCQFARIARRLIAGWMIWMRRGSMMQQAVVMTTMVVKKTRRSLDKGQPNGNEEKIAEKAKTQGDQRGCRKAWRPASEAARLGWQMDPHHHLQKGTMSRVTLYQLERKRDARRSKEGQLLCQGRQR